ncbi:hypothetical protein ACFLVP_03120 [Chloroflexota bacterium]
MHRLAQFIKKQIRKSIARDRALEKQFEEASKSLWPWREAKLIWLVSVLVMLDFISTYTFLELSGNPRLTEKGSLASWALETGDFLFLLLIDFLAVGILIGLAIAFRKAFTRQGFAGYARASFVFLLLPYSVVTFAIVFNNIVLTFI